MPPRSIPTCCKWRRGWRCRAGIRWRSRWRAKAQAVRPYDGATEEPGQGVRAMIDGVEARLGSAEFCGVAAMPSRIEPGASHIYFAHGGRSATIAISQKLRPDAVEVVQALAGSGSICTSCPATATTPCGRSPRRSASPMAGRLEAGGKDRVHRSAESARPPRADGRRRPQRRAGARRRACLAVADRRRRRHAGAGRRGVPGRAAGPGAGRHRRRPPRARADEGKSLAGGDL